MQYMQREQPSESELRKKICLQKCKVETGEREKHKKKIKQLRRKKNYSERTDTSRRKSKSRKY